MAQPALSQQIAALERELGVRLFDRTNRRVALTDAGRAFVARAERVIADLEAAAQEMTAFAGGLRGRVVVGTYQSFAEYILPKLLGRFHAEQPGIEVAMREGMADELLSRLRERHASTSSSAISPAPACLPRLSSRTVVRRRARGRGGGASPPCVALDGAHRRAARRAVRDFSSGFGEARTSSTNWRAQPASNRASRSKVKTRLPCVRSWLKASALRSIRA